MVEVGGKSHLCSLAGLSRCHSHRAPEPREFFKHPLSHVDGLISDTSVAERCATCTVLFQIVSKEDTAVASTTGSIASRYDNVRGECVRSCLQNPTSCQPGQNTDPVLLVSLSFVYSIAVRQTLRAVVCTFKSSSCTVHNS